MLLTILFIVTGALLIFFVIRKLTSNHQYESNYRRKTEPRMSTTENSTARDDDYDDVLGLNQASLRVERAQPQAKSTQRAKKSLAPKYIMLYLIAPLNKRFSGYELLQTILASGLRFGEQQIFHCQEKKADNVITHFSLASATEPGTFDLSKMGSTNVPGLCMFMLLEPMKDNVASFDKMISTAKQLIDDLGGELLDEKRQTLTAAKMSEFKRKIHRYEQTQLIPDLFDTTEPA